MFQKRIDNGFVIYFYFSCRKNMYIFLLTNSKILRNNIFNKNPLFLKKRFKKFLIPIINFYLCKVSLFISTIERRLCVGYSFKNKI